MSEALAPAQLAALVEERATINAHLSMCPPELRNHPSVVRARERLVAIDSALAASARRQAKSGKKIKKLLPQLISQVQGVNPVVASQMQDVLAGKKDAIPSLLGLVASSVNPQLAALAPMVAAMLTDDDDEKE